MSMPQALFLAVLFVICCLALIGLLLEVRKHRIKNPAPKLDDREQVLEMLIKVGDQFSLSIYKAAYKIRDTDITEKIKAMKKNHSQGDDDSEGDNVRN